MRIKNYEIAWKNKIIVECMVVLDYRKAEHYKYIAKSFTSNKL